MKSQLIINSSTSTNFLTRVRDGVLFLLCWAMWAAVLVSVANGAEWGNMKMSFLNWYASQQVFLSSLLANFHISRTYVVMVGTLMCAFLLWSALSMALASQRRRMDSAPLALEDLARHFDVDSVLISEMQREKQVVVFHALSGAVTEVRSKHRKQEIYSHADQQRKAA